MVSAEKGRDFKRNGRNLEKVGPPWSKERARLPRRMLPDIPGGGSGCPLVFATVLPNFLLAGEQIARVVYTPTQLKA